MVLYGLKTCDTCRKALKSLPSAEFKDVREDGVPPDVMAAAYERFGADLLNTRSTTWRNLDQAVRSGDPMALILTYPTLMKRPLIVENGQMYLGWTAGVQAQLLG